MQSKLSYFLEPMGEMCMISISKLNPASKIEIFKESNMEIP